MPTVKRRALTSRHPRVDTLLYPIAMLLKVGGLSQKEAEASFARTYGRALRGNLNIQHIGHHTTIDKRSARDVSI
jgi:hypothetical protein